MTAIDVVTDSMNAVKDGETHVFCCVDRSVMLCGRKGLDYTVVSPDKETTCLVCADLEDTEFCPLGGPCWEES